MTLKRTRRTLTKKMSLERIYQELAPRLAEHKADFTLNKELYARVRRVDRTDLQPWQLRALDDEARRLLDTLL